MESYGDEFKENASGTIEPRSNLGNNTLFGGHITVNRRAIPILANIAAEGVISEIEKKGATTLISGKLSDQSEDANLVHCLLKSDEARDFARQQPVLFLDLRFDQEHSTWEAQKVVSARRDRLDDHRRLAEAIEKLSETQNEYVRGKNLDKTEESLKARQKELDQKEKSIEERESSVQSREAKASKTDQLLQEAFDLEHEASLKDELATFRLLQANDLGKKAEWVTKYLPVLSDRPTTGQKLSPKLWQHLVSSLVDIGIAQDLAASFLLSTFVALTNRRFVLLAGHVGVGKSSLVSRAAELLGGQERFIAIRPGWLDPSDLLGYLDANGNFAKGPLTVKLREPSPIDRFVFILMDELNIGRVENYASDLLAVLGTNREVLELHNGKSCKSELGRIVLRDAYQRIKQKMNDEDRSYFEQLISEDFEDDSSVVDIRRNTVFCGTLNVDHTTDNLSPKMIDRSFLLRFPRANLLDKSPNELPTFEVNTMELQKFSPVASDRWEKFVKQLTGFDGCILPLNFRVRQDYELFHGYGQLAGCEPDDLDHLFSFARILPRIRFSRQDVTTEKCECLLKWLRSMPVQGAMGESTEELIRRIANGDQHIEFQNICG